MLTSLRAWFVRSPAPSADDIAAILRKIDTRRGELAQNTAGLRQYQRQRLADAVVLLAHVRGQIPLANGAVNQQAWQAVLEDEKRRIGDTLAGIFNDLNWVSEEDQQTGRAYFVLFFVLLVAVTAAYGLLHRSPHAGTVEAPTVVGIMTHVRNLEFETKAMTKAKAEGRTPDLKPVQAEVAAVREGIKGVDVGFPALQQLATVESEAQKGDIADTDSVAKLSRVLLADLESLRVAFLWNDRRGRWFEFAWWAEIGVLVGILFFIAGALSEHRFSPADIPMFWAESVIAPVVVLVIFFLFTLTGITGISPTETSITGNVGFAFIFGFAIRRTLGLLDIIKKRIFPDPTPGA